MKSPIASPSPRGLSSFLACVAVCGVSAVASLLPRDGQRPLRLDVGEGSLGAVASEAQECSHIGKNLLSLGGNAVDALVGTTFCVGVIGMYHSGIGGGGFALIRDKAGKYEAVDFRESAPAAAFEDMFEDKVEMSIFSGLAAGVPSEVRGMEYMHTKYGELPWKTVMQGAIEVARDGFRVSGDLDGFIKSTLSDLERYGMDNFFLKDPAWAEDFAPNGTIVREGDHMTRKRYANTLEIIANSGPDAFYSGPLADSWIRTVQKSNGTMTHQDLAAYQVISRPVTEVSYRGVNLYGMGSPAGGAISLHILKIMEQYDPADWDADVPLATHRFDEAMRFAYSARLQLGDPDFVSDAVAQEARMLDSRVIERIVSRITDNQTQPVEYYNEQELYTTDSQGTSHIVTADKDGMATSMTTTVNLIFGSFIMDPETGVVLNNEMNDFSIPGVKNEFNFPPSEANFIRPHKRPLSSCTPIIAAHPNGTLLFTVGAAGGSKIVSATAQIIWHLMEHGYTMEEALRQPRIHDQLMPNQTVVEFEFDNKTVQGLLDRGHEVVRKDKLGSVQGIKVVDGKFEPASEPRQKNSGAVKA